MFLIGLLEKHARNLGKFLGQKVNKLAQTSHCPNVNLDFHCNISALPYVSWDSQNIIARDDRYVADVFYCRRLFVAAAMQPAGWFECAAATCCSDVSIVELGDERVNPGRR